MAAFAWFVRPLLGPDRVVRDGRPTMESIQVHEGLSPDGNRTYAERSLDRIRDEERATAYLRSIVINLARDHNRRGLMSF